MYIHIHGSSHKLLKPVAPEIGLVRNSSCATGAGSLTSPTAQAHPLLQDFTLPAIVRDKNFGISTWRTISPSPQLAGNPDPDWNFLSAFAFGQSVDRALICAHFLPTYLLVPELCDLQPRSTTTGHKTSQVWHLVAKSHNQLRGHRQRKRAGTTNQNHTSLAGNMD